MGIPSGSPGHWRRGLGAHPSAWLCHRPVAAAVGHRLPELAAGGDVELGEDLGQVVLDGARGRGTAGGDLRVRRPVRASRAIWASCGVSWSRGSAVRVRTVSPVASSSRRARSANASHADRGEHVVRGAQLRPGVGPPALAAQPLAVEQVRAGEVGPEAGAAKPVDRLAIAALGVLAVAEQRPGTRVDSLPPVGAGRCWSPGQPAERVRRPARSARSWWPPRSARAAPTSRHAAQVTAQRLAPRPGPSRSGRARCTGWQLPIATTELPGPGPQLGQPCSRPRSAGRPRPRPLGNRRATWPRTGRSGSPSPPRSHPPRRPGEAASAKSPCQTRKDGHRVHIDHELGQRARLAAGLRAARASITCQHSSSHTVTAATTASQLHRSRSAMGISSSAKTRAARLSRGAAGRVPR